MVTEIFINACVLITFTSIFYFFIKDREISHNTSFISKVLGGSYGGLLGVLLLLFSVPVTSNVRIDFRYLAIVLSALFGGILPAVITSSIIGIFRTLYFGVASATLISLIDPLLIGIGSSILSSTNGSRKTKWIHCITYSIIVRFISLIILIKNPVLLFNSLLIYFVAIIFMAYFMFKYTEYLSETAKIGRRFKIEATVDFLTGLNNVRQFEKEFSNFSQQANRKGENLSLLYLDIDYFKKVNDTYGHSSGDIILRDLSEILNNTCRSFDIISRIGGEEFSVLLLDCPGAEAFIIAERIRKNIETNNFYISNKVSICITISIGIATYPDITNKIDNLIKNADSALYDAKKSARNKVYMYSLEK